MPRHGGTLVEVLMSIMIMAIGIVSVATMFPLSMIKSIQATQLTSSTVLRYNAESQIDTNPLMIFDPDGDWLDPPGGPPRADRTFFQDDRTIREHLNSMYVIDPVGFFTMRDEKGETTGEPDKFHVWLGNEPEDPSDATSTLAPITRIKRFPGFLNTDFDGDGDTDNQDGILRGRMITGLPDSWISFLESENVTVAGDGLSITFPNGFDLSPLTVGPGNPRTRVILFDPLGRHSQVRELTLASQVDAAARTISWDAALPTPLATVGVVKIEIQDFRYSWMLLVRRQVQGNASVDVICFQGRPFLGKDEQAYSRELMAAVIPDADPLRGGEVVFKAGSDRAYVQFPTGAATKPWIQKNSFVLDVQNGHFYRIQGYREVQSGANTEVMIQLDHPAAGTGRRAVFMRGVVDVYPIGLKSPALLEAVN